MTDDLTRAREPDEDLTYLRQRIVALSLWAEEYRHEGAEGPSIRAEHEMSVLRRLVERVERAEQALDNCRLYISKAKFRGTEEQETIRRFCAEGGRPGSILRETPS